MASTERDQRPEDRGTGNTKIQLAAVRLLLRSERSVDISDILLATVFDAVATDPKTTNELDQIVKRAWPGIVFTRSSLVATLEAARTKGLLDRVKRLDTTEAWSLASFGRGELTASQDWANDVLRRASQRLAKEARDFLGTSQDEDVARWVSILFDVLVLGIAHAFTMDGGELTVIDDRLLFPSSYDLSFMDSELAKRCQSAEILAFLRAELRVALDPAQEFASELVHYIATGYVLYAYLARRDNPTARSNVGSLTGEQAILDTPVLLEVLADAEARSPALEILTIAINQGVEIAVEASSFTELERVLDQRDADAVSLEEALEVGVDLQTVRATLSDAVLLAWLHCNPLAGKSYLTWSLFRIRAKRLSSTLQAIGAQILTSDNWDLQMSANHASLVASLRTSLPPNARGEWNLEHDARLLVLAEHTRSANPPNANKVWPGSLVVSPDTHMNPAYAMVFGQQSFPVTVTLVQWAGLLGGCATPMALEELVDAITDEVRRRTLFERSVAVPTETAIELARSLRATEVSAADIQDVQLSLEDVLAEQPDVLGIDPEAAREFAARALSKRQLRTNRAYLQHRAALTSERDRVDRQLADAQAAKEEALKSADMVPRSRLAELEAGRERLKRGLLVTVTTALLIVLLVGLVGSHVLVGKGRGVGVLGLIIFVGLGIDFAVHEKRRWYEPLGALIVTLALALLPIFL